MPRIVFSKHALDQMPDRGATQQDVEIAINSGERISVKHERLAFRKNLPFESTWKGRYYETKQVMPIVKKEYLERTLL
ncbi:MAG: DUF4258 domain-containing protein [Chloroflexi bacterium]|nr:DUF4258 domain-containing protein [Chloroflexota bacterium]